MNTPANAPRARVAHVLIAVAALTLALLPLGAASPARAAAAPEPQGTLSVELRGTADLYGTEVVLRAHRKNDDGTWGVWDVLNGRRQPHAVLTEYVSEAIERYTLTLDPGQYRVSVDVATQAGHEPSYAEPTRYVGGGSTLDTAAVITVESGRDTVRTVTAPATGSVSGRVRVPRGVDPRRLTVTTCDPTDEWRQKNDPYSRCVPVRRVTPAADGSWTLPAMVGRQSWTVRVDDPRGDLATVFSGQVYEKQKARAIELERGEKLRGVDLTVPLRGVIQGRITAPAVRRARGVEVWVARLGADGWYEEARVRTDARGRYRVRTSLSGTYRLCWTAGKRSPMRCYVARDAQSDHVARPFRVRHGQVKTINARYFGPDLYEYPRIATFGRRADVGEPVQVSHQVSQQMRLTKSFRWYVMRGGKAVRIRGARGYEFRPDASLAGKKIRATLVLKSKKYGTRTLHTEWVRVHR